jgi:hypothetical protein
VECDVPSAGILNWKLPVGFFALIRGWQLNVLELVKGLKEKNMGMSVDIVAVSEILEAQSFIYDGFPTHINSH